MSLYAGELTQQEQEEEEASTAVPLDAQDSAGGGNNNNDITAGMRRQDSSTSLATVNFGGQNSADGGAASFSGPSVGPGSGGCQPGVITDDVTDDISLSGASVTSGVTARAAAGSDAASLADSASSLVSSGQPAVLLCCGFFFTHTLRFFCSRCYLTSVGYLSTAACSGWLGRTQLSFFLAFTDCVRCSVSFPTQCCSRG